MAEKLYGDRWKIINNLSEGGQGHVYVVEDVIQNNGKKFVLKRLKNLDRVDRFDVEIETIKKFDHPNIVKLVDSNSKAEKPYHVTEYCAGGELTFDKVSKLSIIEKLSLFSTICKAVGYAHTHEPKSIVHRDIKPANIVFQEDGKTPVVTDFGICFINEEGLERVTETIEQAGARYYMAPELRDGRADENEITPQSDVYSLGKLLYWMFKGRVMDRENFADNEWELRNNKSFDHSLNFIYDIFEKTIVLKRKRSFYEKGEDRFSDANELAKEIDKIIYILKQDGRYLDIDIPQRCMFCKIGRYKMYAIPTTYQTNYMTGLSGSFPNYPNPQSGNTDSFCFV